MAIFETSRRFLGVAHAIDKLVQSSHILISREQHQSLYKIGPSGACIYLATPVRVAQPACAAFSSICLANSHNRNLSFYACPIGNLIVASPRM